MAFGIPCKFCGHQETAHECEDSNELLPGMKRTLNKCKDTVKGYVPEDMAEHNRLQKEQDDERRMRMEREYGTMD